MRTNIRQVAERAEVSRMTVSRVLQNRRSEVTDETYERVVAALRELNYVPVQTSVQNYHTKTNVVGVVPHSADIFGYQLDLQTLGGISMRSTQYGYDLLIVQRGESEWMANRQELRFLDRRTDGFIFISPGSGEWQNVLGKLTDNQIPVVVCYRRDVPEGVAWVDPDNQEIARLGVDHLVQHGHTNIAYLAAPLKTAHVQNLLADQSGSRSNFDDGQRQIFFQERLQQLGLPCSSDHIFRVADLEYHVSVAEVEAILASGATGVVCFSRLLSLQLLDHLKHMGLSCPKDLSLVGFDWTLDSRRHGLTHVHFGVDTVGHLAMEAWVGLTEGKPTEQCCRTVPVTLIEGDSVGSPRKI